MKKEFYAKPAGSMKFRDETTMIKALPLEDYRASYKPEQVAYSTTEINATHWKRLSGRTGRRKRSVLALRSRKKDSISTLPACRAPGDGLR